MGPPVEIDDLGGFVAVFQGLAWFQRGSEALETSSLANYLGFMATYQTPDTSLEVKLGQPGL